MTDPLTERLIDVVQNALRDAGVPTATRVSAEDSMETVPGWDSLSFMSVFAAINQAFGLDPDFDDAIHYTSIPKLRAYLKSRGS
jgi:acyl carrier protein